MTGPSTIYNDGVTVGHWAGLPAGLFADFLLECLIPRARALSQDGGDPEFCSLAEGKPITAQPVIADALQVIQCLGIVRDGHTARDQLVELFLVAFPRFGICLGHESRQAITIDKRLLYLKVWQARTFSSCI